VLVAVGGNRDGGIRDAEREPFLELEEHGYREAERETRIVRELPQVARAWRAISGSLYEHGTLTVAQLKALYDGHSIEVAVR
jgi:hypothetical protein